MSDHPKYVVLLDDGYEVPVVFDPMLSHTTICGGKQVVAAGFCSFGTMGGDVTVTTWGESVTLREKQEKQSDTHPWVKGFSSRPQDADLIQRKLNLVD